LATLRPWPGTGQLAGTDVDVSLAAGSPARDRAVALPNLGDVPDGHPDLGALEYGCAAPHYGPRTDGSDATDPGTSCAEIRYRLVIQPYQGRLLATGYDGDTYVGDVTFDPGDRLEIAILNDHVTFGKNGHGFATTGSTVTGPLQVDTSLWDLDSTVGQATVSTMTSLQ
jgi:hypothetical protein